MVLFGAFSEFLSMHEVIGWRRSIGQVHVKNGLFGYERGGFHIV